MQTPPPLNISNAICCIVCWLESKDCKAWRCDAVLVSSPREIAHTEALLTLRAQNAYPRNHEKILTIHPAAHAVQRYREDLQLMYSHLGFRDDHLSIELWSMQEWIAAALSKTGAPRQYSAYVANKVAQIRARSNAMQQGQLELLPLTPNQTQNQNNKPPLT